MRPGAPRIFHEVHAETTEHVSRLARVKSRSHFDGGHLVFEVSTMSRNNSLHEWTEPETVTSLHECFGDRARATRKAIKLHDDARKLFFSDFDAACAETEDA